MRRFGLILVVALFATSATFAQEKKPEKKKEAGDDDAAVKKRLADQQLSLNLDETAFSEALDMLHDLTGVTFVVDPALAADEAKVSLKAKELSVDKALKLMLASVDDATYEVWRGVVFVTSKKKGSKAPAKVDYPEAVKKNLEKKLTLNFNETPLSEVIAFLKDFSGTTFELGKGVDGEKLKVTLRLRDMPAANVLDILCRVAKLDAKVDGEKVILKAR